MRAIDEIHASGPSSGFGAVNVQTQCFHKIYKAAPAEPRAWVVCRLSMPLCKKGDQALRAVEVSGLELEFLHGVN